jgi:hypothetical protein
MGDHSDDRSGDQANQTIVFNLGAIIAASKSSMVTVKLAVSLRFMTTIILLGRMKKMIRETPPLSCDYEKTI